MSFGTFLDRLWTDFWVVLWLGMLLLFWVSAIKCVIKDGVFEAFLILLASSILTSAFLAADAIKILWR